MVNSIRKKSFTTESMNHNNCLHKKISVDKNGFIKNCPSMTESFGHISETTLSEALKKSGFKKYWNINKDQIQGCQDCEFRYVCTDCRAYVDDYDSSGNPRGVHKSKALKCDCDPFTGEWMHWSENPLKSKAKEYYEMIEIEY